MWNDDKQTGKPFVPLSPVLPALKPPASHRGAVLLLTKAFAEARKLFGPGGRIVNVGSLEGFIATLPFGMGAYGSTKTAIRGMTVSLARELGPLGIDGNAIAPGAVVHENLLAQLTNTRHCRSDIKAV